MRGKIREKLYDIILDASWSSIWKKPLEEKQKLLSNNSILVLCVYTL